MAYLTLPTAWLRARGACLGQVRQVERAFGTHVPLTPAVVEAAALAGLSVEWLYPRLRAAAWAKYERARAPAWAEYDRVMAAAWAEYDRVRGAARAEFDRAGTAAWAEFDRAVAAALGRILSRRSSWKPEVLAAWEAMLCD